MLGMAALFLLAGMTASALTLVLSGVILSAIAVAGIALVLSLSPSPWAAGEIVRWLLGALTDRSLDDLIICHAAHRCRRSVDTRPRDERSTR